MVTPAARARRSSSALSGSAAPREPQRTGEKARPGSGGRRGAKPPGGREAPLPSTPKKFGDSQRQPGSISRRSSGRSRHRAAFEPVLLKRFEFQDLVSEELERIAESEPYGKRRRRLKRKAVAFRLCGRTTVVETCRDCGTDIPGTGVQKASAFPCNVRVCNVCERRASKERCDELLASITVAAERAPKDFGLRKITLTTHYNPSDPNEVTVEALRERALGLIAAVSHVWRCGLRDARFSAREAKGKRKKVRRGTGLHMSIEMGLRGNVHAHLIYFGPYINKKWLLKTAGEACDRIGGPGQSKVNRIKRDGLRDAVREAVKYVYKGVSPLCERWFSEAREVTHPRLLARWEAAIEGVHMHSTFGSFREKAAPEVVESLKKEQEASKPEACPFCGSLAPRVLSERDTATWVRRCHGSGFNAFKNTRDPPSGAIEVENWDEFIAQMYSGADLREYTKVLWRQSPANCNDEREIFVV